MHILNLAPLLSLSAPSPPIRVEDSPPGWLAIAADLTVLIAGIIALATLIAMIRTHLAAGPRIELHAIREGENVYVTIVNEGRMASEIRSVFLGTLNSEPDQSGDIVWHLHPEVESTDFTPRMFEAKSSDLITFTWPQVLEASIWDDQKNAPGLKPVEEADVLAFISTHNGYKFTRILPAQAVQAVVKWDEDQQGGEISMKKASDAKTDAADKDKT